MFRGIFRIGRYKQVEHPFVYNRSKGKMKFCFTSEIPMRRKQLTTAMDIICDIASKGINKNAIILEIKERCFSTLDSGCIAIESHDEGKSWKVWISDNPVAFL